MTLHRTGAKGLGRLIRSASLSGYVDLVRSLGGDPQALLRRVGLSTRLLQDPETLIPGDAVREVLELAAHTTGVEDFALRLAARRSLSNLGPISLVLREEATPRQALDTLCHYLKLLNASLITRIEEVGSDVVIREDLLPSRGLATRQSMELAVGVMFRILTELVGPGWRPRRVCFTHTPPADGAAHRLFFGRYVAFDQVFNGLVCASADLRHPRNIQDPDAARFARAYLESALQHREHRASETCRELILALLPGGRCTAEAVARHLRVDRRTLHRHLSEDGLTFSELLDEVRVEIAIRHLQGSSMPIAEVSQLLGFSAPSGFSHWFRAHFGCTVSQWRRRTSVQPAGAQAALSRKP